MPIKRPYGAHTGPMQIGNLTFGSLGLGFRRFEALRFEAFVIIISIMTIIIIIIIIILLIIIVIKIIIIIIVVIIILTGTTRWLGLYPGRWAPPRSPLLRRRPGRDAPSDLPTGYGLGFAGTRMGCSVWPR